MKVVEERSSPRSPRIPGRVRAKGELNRFQKILLIVAAIVLACLAFRQLSLWWAVSQWDDIQTNAKNSGDTLTPAWKPEAVSDEENFAADPWITDLLKANESYGVTVLHNLNPSKSYAGYSVDPDQPSWFSTHPEERQKLIATGRGQSGDLAAIRAAAAKPKCRLPGTPSITDPEWAARVNRLSPLADALAVHADAAFADDRPSEGVSNLVALLQMSAHLQDQHALLPLVISFGMEIRAIPLIQRALNSHAITPSDKERLLAACRTRPLEEELVDTLRTERTMFLNSLDVIAATPRPFPDMWEGAFWKNLVRSNDQDIARNRTVYCEAIAPVMKTYPTRAEWRTWASEIIRTQRSSGSSVSFSPLHSQAAIVDSSLAHDDDLIALRKRLAE